MVVRSTVKPVRDRLVNKLQKANKFDIGAANFE